MVAFIIVAHLRLSERQLEIVRASKGSSGNNQDYVVSTARHLREMGVRDHALEWLSHRLDE